MRRSPGAVPDTPPATALTRGDRILISICLALVCALAWAYLVHLGRQMSAEMEFHAAMGMSMMDLPWTMADVLFTFAMWTVMMVGMMAGSAAPVLLLFAASRAKRAEPGVKFSVLMFGLGYLAVWTGFSAGAALAQWALHEAAMLSPAMSASSPYLAGAILIGAGAYQLTPWKGACLTHCQSPLGFLMAHWREGPTGALRMGIHHGVYCLGCCWAIMCVLFVVGVMNLVWVAVLTVFVLIEKVGPAGTMVARLAGGAMVIAGIVKLASASGIEGSGMELPPVAHVVNGHRGAFAFDIDGKRLAEMAYSVAGDGIIIIEHTDVNSALRGTGAGKMLLAALVEWARAEGKKVIPICPFAKSVFEKTPEFQDVLK